MISSITGDAPTSKASPAVGHSGGSVVPGKDFEPHICQSTGDQPESSGCTVGKINDAVAMERTAIVDAHNGRTSIREVRHTNPGAEWKTPVSGGEGAWAQHLSTGGAVPEETRAVPACSTMTDRDRSLWDGASSRNRRFAGWIDIHGADLLRLALKLGLRLSLCRVGEGRGRAQRFGCSKSRAVLPEGERCSSCSKKDNGVTERFAHNDRNSTNKGNHKPISGSPAMTLHRNQTCTEAGKISDEEINSPTEFLKGVNDAENLRGLSIPIRGLSSTSSWIRIGDRASKGTPLLGFCSAGKPHPYQQAAWMP